MKLPVVLAVLVGTLVLACSIVTPVPAGSTPNTNIAATSEPTPNVDETVEARLAHERSVDAIVRANVSPTSSAEATTTSNKTQQVCKLTGGETVQSGWARKDTGSNYCNGCFYTNGALGCTKMACPP